MTNDCVVSQIVLLLLGCCPIAVFRGITLAVVASINGMICGRPWPHVGVEIFERIPSLAYRYASAAVSGVIGSVRIGAAITHGAPYNIFWSFMHTMLRGPSYDLLSIKASAALSVAPSNIASLQNLFRSACALAQPHGIAFFIVFDALNDAPSPKGLALHVYTIAKMRSSHGIKPPVQVDCVVRAMRELALSCGPLSMPCFQPTCKDHA